ncbi:MAG: hypothetical protein GY814_05195 [Gammaproteobacteria bacterium]|nr:hypothetical protein [Gammaproteobacteria bacterium]
MAKKLSAKDQQFADLYFGGPDDVRGNATACYRYLHPRAKDNTCQVEGSKTLSKPIVSDYLQSRRENLTGVTGINAEYVLRQAIRLYKRAMGDEPFEIDLVTPSGEIRTSERREYNPQVAKASLELIGKHTQVQAFQDNVEHTHTHQLERALARAHQNIEAKAAANPVIEGKVIEAENTGGEAEAVEKAALERKLELVE